MKATAKPFTTTDPLAPDDDLKVLDPFLEGVAIVGLGEATHGTSEFFRMKHRLLRYLVERKGCQAFGLEADMALCRALDDHVMTGTGDPRTLVASLGMWPWTTEEMMALVVWLREHNAKVPLQRKVRFFGFDFQDAKAAVDQVLAYVEPLETDGGANLRALYAPYRSFVGLRNPLRLPYRNAPVAVRGICHVNLHLAYWWMVDHRDDYVAATGEDAYAWALRMAQGVIQHEAFQGAEDYPHPVMALNLRDRFMADNVDWAVQRHGAGAPVALWAHNGHINKKGSAAPLWTNTGDWLVQRHGTSYLAVGFAFGSGGFNSVPVDHNGEEGVLQPFHVPPPDDGFYEHAFLTAGLSHAFLDLRNLDLTDPGARWFSEEHSFREVGTTYSVEPGGSDFTANLVNRFDLLIYLRSVSPSRLLRQDQMPVFTHARPSGLRRISPGSR